MTQFINNASNVISNTLIFIFTLIIFINKNWISGLVFIFWSIFYFFVYIKLSDKIKKQSEITAHIESECSGKMIDCFTNILNIKNFTNKVKEKYNIKKHTTKILTERYKIVKLQVFSENIEIYGRMKQAVDTLTVPIKITDKKHAKKLENLDGKIVFKNITFSYEQYAEL